MDLILFIILGAVLFARIGMDKSASKSASRLSSHRIEWHKERIEDWRKLVSDRALEEDLANFIRDPQNYDEVWNEVYGAYLQMPSYKSLAGILLYPSAVEQYCGKGKYTKKQCESIAAANCQNALDIMLAKRGKVRYVNTCDGWHVKDLVSGEGVRSRRVWDEAFEFWVYIRDELRKHGVPARLIFKTGGFQEHQQMAYDADDINEFHYQNGMLTWIQLTYFDEGLKYV